MKRVALVHTVKSVYDTFPGQLREALGDSVGELKLHNLMDDFLADDPADTGVFSTNNKARLYNDLQAAYMTGADLIVVTCSTLSPTVAEIRPFIPTRIVSIDEAMAQKAVTSGRKIGLLVTAKSTLEPSKFKLMEEAQKAGREVEIEVVHTEDAIRALKAGDKARHDQLVLEMASQLHDVDVIVLAQASMAHMEEPVAAQTGRPVFSSPKLCIQQVKTILESSKM